MNLLSVEEVWKMLVPSLISMLCCCTVLLTPILFPSVRKKPYVQCMCLGFFSLLLKSFASTLGYPEAGSVACWIQATFAKFFATATGLWISIVTVMIYYLTFYGKIFKISWKHHLLVWGVASLATFLPFMHLTSGPSAKSHGWCLLKDRPSAPGWAFKFWGLLTELIPPVLYCTIMVYVLIRLKVANHYLPEGAAKVHLTVLVRRMQGVPVIAFTFTVIQFFVSQLFGSYINIIYSGAGTVITAWFWCTNDDLRDLWVEYLSRVDCCLHYIDYLPFVAAATPLDSAQQRIVHYIPSIPLRSNYLFSSVLLSRPMICPENSVVSTEMKDRTPNTGHKQLVGSPPLGPSSNVEFA